MSYAWQTDPRVGTGEATYSPAFTKKELKETPRSVIKKQQKTDGEIRKSVGNLGWFLLAVGVGLYIFNPSDSILIPLSSFVLGGTLLILSALSERGANMLKKMTTKPQTDVKVWGFPGDGLEGAEERLGKSQVIMGKKGEKKTGEALEPLLRIPSVRVFHGMIFPGSYTADVDHIVLSGNKVVLVDSKFWKPCQLSWTPEGDIKRAVAEEDEEVFNVSMHEALKRYKRIISKDAKLSGEEAYQAHEARGYIVVHSSTQRGQVILDSEPYEGLRMVTAEELVEELGEWFLDDELVVNRRLLRLLLAHRPEFWNRKNSVKRFKNK